MGDRREKILWRLPLLQKTIMNKLSSPCPVIARMRALAQKPRGPDMWWVLAGEISQLVYDLDYLHDELEINLMNLFEKHRKKPR